MTAIVLPTGHFADCRRRVVMADGAALVTCTCEERELAIAGLEEPLFRQCMGCGCTDEHACPGGCSWVTPRLCSRCAT